MLELSTERQINYELKDAIQDVGYNVIKPRWQSWQGDQ